MFSLLKNLTLTSLLLLGAMSFTQTSFAGELDSKSAIVRLEVAKFARITGLDDFVLSPLTTDGDAGSIYQGFDMFNLESNSAVSVTMVGGQLSKGSNSISTSYKLDDDDLNFETAPGIHNAAHKVSAAAELGQISSQEAGDYSAQITITVSSL
jgi:hypothetical protein